MNFRTILISLAVASILFAAYFFNAWLDQKRENARLTNNFAVLVDEMRAENFKSVQVLTMTVKEIKNSFPDLEEKIKKDFDVKLKNAVQYSQIKTEVNHTFKAPVKPIDWDKLGHTADSVIRAIMSRGIPIDTLKLKTFSYTDAWLDFNAVEIDDTVYVDRNKTPVPLDQLVHRDKWRFKYLFKKRPLFQQVKSDNPYAEIKFNRIIEIQK
jgi:hypothetical protein